MMYPEVRVLGGTLLSVGEAVANKAHTIPNRDLAFFSLELSQPSKSPSTKRDIEVILAPLQTP